MRSIRGKLWLGMMTLVVVVLLLLWLLQIVFLDSFYSSQRIADIKGKVSAIVQLVQSGSSQETVEFELDRLSTTQNLDLEWLDKDGQVVHQSSANLAGQMPMMMNMVRTELYQTVLSGKPVETSVFHPRFGNKYTLIGLPLRATSGEPSGAIMATVPMATVTETVAILKRQLVYITIVLLAVTALVSLWLARSFTKPILQIRQVSAAMANGDFSARTAYHSPDEIGTLATSINYLGEQLAKIEQLRRDLVANVSHELRTPLSVIRGYAETIRDISGGQPEQRDPQLAIIIEETERLTNLVNDNLQLAVLQSGNADLKLRAFPLRDLLQDTIERYTVMAAQKGVGLTLQSARAVNVQADEAKIEQVVRNLLQNSLQHTAAGGQIVIQTIEQEQAIRITVADTGSGIAAADLPHIWDEYFRGQSKSATVPRGTGLGLAIVKGILQAHQANFGAASELGVGTTVWFELKRQPV